MSYGLLIDYNYCSGCYTCRLACQQEHDFEPEVHGIEIRQVGPRKLPKSKNASENWEYDYIPIPTELCDFCGKRLAKGKLPSCVQHCQAACMYFGEVTELVERMGNRKMVLFTK